VGYLLNDEFDKAKQVAINSVDKTYDDNTFSNLLWNRIYDFEKLEISHPDFNRIKSFLMK